MNSLTPWRQDDGSIVDVYWNVISQDRVLKIITTVNSLPAIAEKANFLDALEDNPIVIVEWETGSGKSTQLPKFAHLQYPDKSIVVTQPRIIAATSLAERVSDEVLCQLWDPNYSLGYTVGYRTGVWKMWSHRTKLWFHTDGTEGMRQTMSDIIPDILFIDEVHGFSIHTEVLAMLSRYHQRAMKLVIMSATIDPWIFREYFRWVSRDIPLISIPGRTFGVTSNFDAWESQLFDNNIEDAIRANENVLIFAPGKKEINTLIEELQKKFGNSAEILPLHAEMPKSEQNILLTKKTNIPRIVVATNIAEESITIPYMHLVADLGTQKVLRYTRRGIPTLGIEDTALSNSTQRAWRVGRTMPGFYNRFNLTPSVDLLPYPEAPIQREMIDRHILTLLSEGIDIIDMIYTGAKNNQSPFFHQIDMWLLEVSLTRLRAIWALTAHNKLTVLGHELLKFPVDVYHARMLYESIEQKCTGNMINIVSILEKKWFVSSKEEGWKKLLSQKQYNSDIRAYCELLELCICTTLSPKQLKKLKNLGISDDELMDFMDRDGNMKLYEVVNLSPIGIKNKKIKEIDECRDVLIDRFASMWIELTSWNKIAQSISLASWYMHNVYVFNQTNDLFSPVHVAYENYAQWDVSVVIPQYEKQYLANPFIILDKGEVGNFSLVTMIMEISSIARIAAKKSNVIYSGEEYQKPREKKSHRDSPDRWNRNTPPPAPHACDSSPVIPEDQIPNPNAAPEPRMKTARVLKGVIVPLYESLIAEFATTQHETTEDAQIYYLDNCLVPFLFEYNVHIRKYISWRSEEWKQYFSRLLIRFLRENDLYRINPNNIPKTETSFKHDADIIRRIQESKDQFIRDFRLHGVPKVITPVLPDIRENTANNIQSIQLWSIKRQYAQLLWQIKQYTRNIPLHEIEILALKNTLKDIQEWNTENEVFQAYIEILDRMKKLESLSDLEIRAMMKSVKQIWAKRKELRKNQAIHKKMIDFQKLLNSTALTESNRKKLIEAIDFAFLVPLDEYEKRKYLTFVNRITSPDLRKRKRVINNKQTGLSYYQWIVVRNIWSVVWNIDKYQWLVDLDNCPDAKNIFDWLWIIIKGIFHDNYNRANMETKVYEIMRIIIRDNITDRKWLYQILFEWLQRNQVGQHMNGVSSLFNPIVRHCDLQDEVESYRTGWAIYTSMLESQDVTEIDWYVAELQALIEKLKSSVPSIDNNQLWQIYCGTRR